MNREIKFRAYDKEVEKMTYFDDEDYLYNYPFILRQEQVFKKDSNYDDYEDFEYKDITNKVELMQYTGLHDKNGKEIYEGDIITNGDKNIKYIVGWYDTGLKARQYNNRSYIGLKYWQDVLEVIGNIYDNQELLGGE